jgi:hypothetical protein
MSTDSLVAFTPQQTMDQPENEGINPHSQESTIRQVLSCVCVFPNNREQADRIVHPSAVMKS